MQPSNFLQASIDLDYVVTLSSNLSRQTVLYLSASLHFVHTSHSYKSVTSFSVIVVGDLFRVASILDFA